MGTVYKLKKEVIDFILQKKNENHALSCRQVAVIAGERFKIQVSKSSVNTVIKNARLSSSVGRRALGDGRPKKFHIPSVKKKQISEDMKKVGFASVPSHPPVSEERKKFPSVDKESDDKPQEQKAAFSAAAGARDASYGKFLEYVRRWRETSSEQKRPIEDGMGLVFLKGIEWGISGRAILGKVFKRHFKKQPSACFEGSCEVVPYLNMLGVQDKEGVMRFRGHALWTLSRSLILSEVCEILDWTKESKLFQALLMEYDNEIGQAFLHVDGFEICLENGRSVYMDAQLTSLWRDRPPYALGSSLNKAVSLLSRSFISNNDPAIFFTLGNESFPLEEAAETMSLGQLTEEKHIRRIIAFDRQNDPIVEFSTVPFKKRLFLTGVWPWQKHFPEFAKYVYSDGYQPTYFKRLDAIFYYKELNGNEVFFKSKLIDDIRVISVLDEDKNRPVAVILTNHAKMSAEDLVQAFILRWPSLDNGFVGEVIKKMSIAQHDENIDVINHAGLYMRNECGVGPFEGSNISMILDDFENMLKERCYEQLFMGIAPNIRDGFLKAICRDIPGSCVFSDNVRHVVLNLTPDHPYLKEIKRAVLVLNESAVTDFDGHLLLVQCDIKEIPK